MTRTLTGYLKPKSGPPTWWRYVTLLRKTRRPESWEMFDSVYRYHTRVLNRPRYINPKENP